MKIHNKTKKGFTLMELIIVIAIIGILAALLTPLWGTLIARARVRSQNNNSKIIFDAAQKQCIDLKRRTRTVQNEIKRQQEIINSPTQDAVAKAQAQIALEEALKQQYVSTDFYFYWDGENGYACDENGNDISANAEMNKEFADAVNRNIETSEKVVYKIHVKDFNVMSVASGRYQADRSIGSYPVTRDKKTNGGLKNFDLSKAELGTVQDESEETE